MKVLVAEDDTLIRKAMVEVLEGEPGKAPARSFAQIGDARKATAHCPVAALVDGWRPLMGALFGDVAGHSLCSW